MTRFYYAASADYILLSAYESDLPRFAQVEGLEDLPDLPEEDRAAYLATEFQSQPAAEWVSRLRTADLAATICENLEALRALHSRDCDDNPGTENGSYSFSVYADHPSGHEVTQLDPYAVRPTQGKVFAVAPFEKFGTSTRAILRDLGYAEKAIQQMIDSGDLSTSWAEEYLPS